MTVRIHMMTPVLTTGDAIGNYMISLRRAFAQLGVTVRLYADYIDPAYQDTARPTAAYHPTGSDILWFHYSIWSENFAVLDQSTDFKVMDYHGITPAHLMQDDPRLAAYCDQAIKALPAYSRFFDWCIYHADNGLDDLQPAGYTRFSKVRLPVDTAFFGLKEDEELAALVRQLDYILFVGRIVPQKDVLSIVRVFAEVQKQRPDAVLFLVGGTDVLPPYVERVRDEIRRLGIQSRVQMTGKISDRAALTTLYRHANFLICLSDWESFFVPAVEALSFGVPVIYTGEPPVSENVGDAGVVIDKRDPVDAARRINAVWENDEVYCQLQANALRRSDWFTDAALSEALRAVLRDWTSAFDRSPRGSADERAEDR
jgi:L-malate glycosyltransferase